MMSYEEWLSRVIEAARDIASPKFQQEAWFPGGNVVSSPDEVYQFLMEDSTFDLFIQTYRSRLTEEQMRSANELRSKLEAYYDKMPDRPDPRQILDDPEWNAVRQAAERFVQNFSGKAGLGRKPA